mgnify:CR=1 FL=1
MLDRKELDKIRELLEKSQNPLFLFDNDADGLCSFLILQRAIGRGKGLHIKSFPELEKQYLRKIEELNPDAVFILDKPRISEEFIKGVIAKNLPLIIIDHHAIEFNFKDENLYYFNSAPSSEPVTYLCYKVFERKQDQWVAMIGCIGDVYMPDFAPKFAEEYPELFNVKYNAFDAMYTTEIGKIVKMLNFGLKDTTTNVVKLIKFLIKANSAHDILEENANTKQLHFRYRQIDKLYNRLIEKALAENKNSKLLFFSYAGEMSMSAELSNELYFKNKNKLVVVAFRKHDRANISVRGKNAKRITLEAIKNIERASGGGHEVACGAQVPIDKLDEFKKKIEELVG